MGVCNILDKLGKGDTSGKTGNCRSPREPTHANNPYHKKCILKIIIHHFINFIFFPLYWDSGCLLKPFIVFAMQGVIRHYYHELKIVTSCTTCEFGIRY